QSLIDFCLAHPEIVLDVRLDDRFVDLVEEGFDLAIRITRLQDSSLIAKRLSPFHSVLFRAPGLIARVGNPDSPEGLADRPCIIGTNARSRNSWHFRNAGGSMMPVPVNGPIEVNSHVATKAAALAGLGFSMMPAFIAEEEIER